MTDVDEESPVTLAANEIAENKVVICKDEDNEVEDCFDDNDNQ